MFYGHFFIFKSWVFAAYFRARSSSLMFFVCYSFPMQIHFNGFGWPPTDRLSWCLLLEASSHDFSLIPSVVINWFVRTWNANSASNQYWTVNAMRCFLKWVQFTTININQFWQRRFLINIRKNILMIYKKTESVTFIRIFVFLWL